MLTGTTTTGKTLSGIVEVRTAARFAPVRVSCSSCSVAVVNGHICHEHGCPDAWRDEERKCKWCGQRFKPEDRNQLHCDQSCYNPYHGLDDDGSDD